MGGWPGEFADWQTVLLLLFFLILGLAKVPFGDCFLFFLGFLSKS